MQDIDKSIRLNPDSYFHEKHPKNAIVIHHTSGRSAQSTIDWWQKSPERIATAYIIERDGAIYELFDPSYWAYHLGIPGNKGIFDRRSIGIEIASEGGLIEYKDKLYCFDRISNATEYKRKTYEHEQKWRGHYRYFAEYTTEQSESVLLLIDFLCNDFNIPRRTPADHLSFNPALFKFKGVIGHHHVRPDKTDPHPGFEWDRLLRKCRLITV